MAKENSKPGGRKGGTLYPKIDLEKAVKYSKKLVSKTHTGPQPDSIILTGVFDSGTWPGKERLSATKQFGLLNGDSKAYNATELAKKINSSPVEELPEHLKEACLKPKMFKTLYDTFINDTVTDAKIKQQLLNHEVHPESADECVGIFKASLIYAGLAQLVDTDKFQVLGAPVQQKKEAAVSADPDNEDDSKGNEQKDGTDIGEGNQGQQNPELKIKRNSNSSNVNVNIDIDPSMDPEKLEKLLKLLKNYGAI